MSLLGEFAKGLRKGLKKQCLYCRHPAVSFLEGMSVCALHFMVGAATFYVKEHTKVDEETVSNYMAVMLQGMREEIIKDLIFESEMHTWAEFIGKYTQNGTLN